MHDWYHYNHQHLFQQIVFTRYDQTRGQWSEIDSSDFKQRVYFVTKNLQQVDYCCYFSRKF